MGGGGREKERSSLGRKKDDNELRERAQKKV